MPPVSDWEPLTGMCALEGTRTPGLQVRNLSLYPLSYERMHDLHYSRAGPPCQGP